MKGKWIYYDPDFRREVWPKPDYPTCETCQRKINPEKAVRVQTYNDFPVGTELVMMRNLVLASGGTPDLPPYEMTARENSEGKHFIGRDCWNRLTREFGFEGEKS